jgi:hypothetical protein
MAGKGRGVEGAIEAVNGATSDVASRSLVGKEDEQWALQKKRMARKEPGFKFWKDKYVAPQQNKLIF